MVSQVDKRQEGEMYFKKSLFDFLILFLGSLLLVTGSLFLPSVLREKAQSTTVEFGLPLKFIVQQQYTGGIGIREGPSLPYMISIQSPWENPTQFIKSRYFLNILIVFGIAWLVFASIKQVKNGMVRTTQDSDIIANLRLEHLPMPEPIRKYD